ncbi:metallothiol transferase FosB [Senna tora]|uniref:Metallothiol transferase FosB n=1 Tax=Senna tora TaxID=362788 RepID=A0A834T4A1_9FABA|nr:metallothiol transferase FosB [Senna tora]
MKESVGNPLHLKSVNHISLVCKSVEESMNFYHNVLGFDPIRRPGSFDFNGACGPRKHAQEDQNQPKG